MRYRNWWVYGWCLLALSGCATSLPQPTSGPAAPLPDDLGWSSVTVEVPPAPPDRTQTTPPGPAEKVLPYVAGVWMKLRVPAATPVMLELGPDEWGKDVKFVQDEELKPWTIDYGQSGTSRSALHVMVTEPSQKVRLIATTTKRTYLLELQSVATNALAVVRWQYPPEPVPAPVRLLPDLQVPTTYYTGYTMTAEGAAPVWMPRQVVNDEAGQTFIVFPSYLPMIEFPMARLVGPTGPMLIHPKLIGHVLRLDHLISHALELRRGDGPQAEVVRITRGPLVPMQCPGAEGCPSWQERIISSVRSAAH